MKNELKLNEELFKACKSKVIDYNLVENLLKQGAKPLGKITEYGWDNNLYSEVISDLFLEEEITEDLYRITELFLKYGMDISKPSVPYNESSVETPLWIFGFPANEVVIRTLKLLLDNGLNYYHAGACWIHELSDFINVYGELDSDIMYEEYYDYIRKLMLIASYPHVLNADEELQNAIWLKYNDYDVTKFHNWNEFSFSIDTSHCDGSPKVYKSIVTIIEKSTGKAVWKFGTGLKPENIM